MLPAFVDEKLARLGGRSVYGSHHGFVCFPSEGYTKP